jgi:hypothetical protein
MKQSLPTIALIFLIGFAGHSQIIQKIGNNPTTLNPSAVLEVESTTKGFLPPRMTTVQRDAITPPPAGLTVYNITTNTLQIYNGTAWLDCNPRREVVVVPVNGTIKASGTQSQIFHFPSCPSGNCRETVVLPRDATDGLEHTMLNKGTGTVVFKYPTEEYVLFMSLRGKDLITNDFVLNINQFVKVTYVDFKKFDPNSFFTGAWLFYD